jgi:hypothetical protein
MEPELIVHHFLLARQAKIDESWAVPGADQAPSFVLRGLSYCHRVEPDTEFPKDERPPGSVYLRLEANSAGSTSVLLRVHYRTIRGWWQEMSYFNSHHPIPFFEDAVEVRDLAMNLPYLRLGGVGLHAITVHFCPTDDVSDSRTDTAEAIVMEWSTDPEEIFGEYGWKFGAVDYFWVERQT